MDFRIKNVTKKIRDDEDWNFKDGKTDHKRSGKMWI